MQEVKMSLACIIVFNGYLISEFEILIKRNKYVTMDNVDKTKKCHRVIEQDFVLFKL